MSIEVLVENDDLIQHLEDKANEIPERLSQLVSECAFIIQSSIMDEAPVVTHNLQANTFVENIDEFTSRVYVDEGNVPYALFVINGTSPHLIYPVDAQSLYWPGLGHPMPKGRPVEHPGTSPNDYFTRGLENSRTSIDDEVENFKNWLME